MNRGDGLSIMASLVLYPLGNEGSPDVDFASYSTSAHWLEKGGVATEGGGALWSKILSFRSPHLTEAPLPVFTSSSHHCPTFIPFSRETETLTKHA